MSRSDEHDEQEIVAQMQQQMRVLDDAYEPVNIPSLASLEAQVRERRQVRKRANRIEMIMFWIVGLFVITCGVLLFHSAPALYLGIQALSLGGAIAVVAIWTRRRRKETRHE
ncbi:YxlC family protein [Paenibacillus pabuli]|uniref:YxlC family protein n=1 Tax=Paenibacillus pabuli TaxID=1472 RepID=UPI003CE682A8